MAWRCAILKYDTGVGYGGGDKVTQPMSTKEHLVHLLRVHGSMTTAELTSLLGVSPNAVRQHLDRLQGEGWIEVSGLRRGHGRPQQLFALTTRADGLFPQQYDALALDLLHAINELPEGADLIHRILTIRRREWQNRYSPRLTGETLEERLAQVTDLLNENGAMASYIAEPDGSYLLFKHHCGIAAVVAQYPLFCQEEQAWLEEALEASVEPVQSRSGGARNCAFRIYQEAAQVTPVD